MRLSRIDIIGQNGNDGEHYAEMNGDAWLETGSPWPQEDLQTRVDFEASANFDVVPEQ